MFRSLGFIEEGLLGREMCGHVLKTGAEVSTVSPGDHIAGLGFGAFGPQMITHEELVTGAPPGFSVSELATVPSALVSAALSFEHTGLEAGERVLIHAGAGGVGLAAIQLVQAAGTEVFATASAPKQDYLRSLGVTQIFDSRTTAFGQEILEATGGKGVDVVLNSLTGEGFIDASLSCLRQGGRFVEMARRDILSEEDMAAARPDVDYYILELDVLKKTEPARVGRVLRDMVARLSPADLKPIIHSRWPLAEAGDALAFMRSARHLGKIVVTTPPLVRGRLRQDRFEEVLWPKILGGWHLHRATAQLDLEFFILFSSRVGVMGNLGQANHAAAKRTPGLRLLPSQLRTTCSPGCGKRLQARTVNCSRPSCNRKYRRCCGCRQRLNPLSAFLTLAWTR